ncbi:methyl-accepting chemotaxis protein [Pseudomonas seleniipraecipitans]|uniref:Methyl-accepting chemotaxis protein n=2 Tax=Phytopseudomonas seleniipraecipitans TaxID=640205 RepID=A0A1G7RRV5_9GAMM|nr:methyl-accepting chemotaxis protein [Pseudomonas seleniipraecipitans]
MESREKRWLCSNRHSLEWHRNNNKMKSMSLALRQLSIGTLLAVGFSLLCGLSVLLAAAIAFNLQAVFQGEAQLERIASVHTGILDSRIAEKSYRLEASKASGDQVRTRIQAIAQYLDGNEQAQRPLLEAGEHYLEQFERLTQARERLGETRQAMIREADEVRVSFESVEQDLTESLMQQDSDMVAALVLAESAMALMRKLLALRTAEWAYSEDEVENDYDQWILLLSDLRSSTQALAGGAQAQQREALDVALGSLERYRTAFEAYHASAAASRETEREMERIAEQMLGVSSAMRAQVSERQQQLKGGAYSWLVVMGLLVLILGAATAWFIRRQIIHSLRDTAALVEQFAAGRLGVHISERSDELGLVQRAMGRMGESLHGVVSRIEQGALGLSAASRELAQVTEEMAQGAEQQAQETERVFSAMQAMGITLGQVVSLTGEASSAAGSARQGSEASRGDVEATVKQISQLDELVREAGQGMRALDARSTSIGGVLGVIQGLVEQTNLLALNAAIEAARAGDMGRGFSVVADEVRSLANRTQGSAAEIATMIDSLQRDSKNVLSHVERAGEESVRAREHSSRASLVLSGVSTDVSTIHQMNLQIASATEAQNRMASEVGQSMVQVREAALQGQARSHRLRGACQELEQLAGQLRQALGYFKLN